MGSVRRGLILALLPGAASAEVCAQIRPDWDGTPMTATSEAIALFATLPSLALILATLAALRFRSQWGGLAVVVGWSLWTSILVFVGGRTLRPAAVAEGCMGSQTLFMVAVVAICVGTILYTLPRETRL